LPMAAIELQPKTLQAWDEYIRVANSRMQARLDGRRPFLWADEAADRSTRLRRGEILVAPVSGRGTHSAPDGLIHDWIGAIFIPKATAEVMLGVVRDYARYKDFYKPVVAESKLLACTEKDQRFYMVLQHKTMLINAAVETQYQAYEFPIDDRRGYSVTATTRVREIEGYGRSDEHFLPPDQGNGFIWRLQSIVRYQERDGGLYLEMEAIALTRDIPFSLRWLVSPMVNHMSIDSLLTSLRQTRDAVNSRAGKPESLVSCAGGSRNVER